MADYDWLSDDELEKRVEQLRGRAHDAKETNYAARSNDWAKAKEELAKRKAWRKSGECLPADHPGHC